MSNAAKPLHTSAESSALAQSNQVSKAEANRANTSINTPTNPKPDIVSVIRGYYALPLLISLYRAKVLEQLNQDEVGYRPSTPKLAAACRYLASLGWAQEIYDSKAKGGNNEPNLPKNPNSPSYPRYRSTRLGASVFKRVGAYGIIYSYRPYFENLDGVLFDEPSSEGASGGPASAVTVQRGPNVVGSGSAHSNKFFSQVDPWLKDLGQKASVLDIGCGDGTFLARAKSFAPECRLMGVDLSPEALAVTRVRHPQAELHQGSVAEPGAIAKTLSRAPDLVSVWFIFHEVLGFEGIEHGALLSAYRQAFPQSRLIVGELFHLEPEILAPHHQHLAIPEFDLFHALSGQKIVSRSGWENAIEQAGYRIEAFLGLDEVDGHYGSGVFVLSP